MSDSAKSSAAQAVLDRRTSTRVDYAARVTVCEHNIATGAEEAEFRVVKASNLSQTGVSFVTTDWPTDDRLVVGFGETDPARVIARIVNIRCEELEGGDRRFEVSCEFGDWLPSSKEGAS